MQRYVKLTKPGYEKEFEISISADDFLSAVDRAVRHNRGLSLVNKSGTRLLLGIDILRSTEITIEVR